MLSNNCFPRAAGQMVRSFDGEGAKYLKQTRIPQRGTAYLGNAALCHSQAKDAIEPRHDKRGAPAVCLQRSRPCSEPVATSGDGHFTRSRTNAWTSATSCAAQPGILLCGDTPTAVDTSPGHVQFAWTSATPCAAVRGFCKYSAVYISNTTTTGAPAIMRCEPPLPQ